MQNLLFDLRLGLRRLRRDPNTTVAILLLLTLGIGVTATFLTLVRGLWLTPPSQVEEADELTRLVRFSKETAENSWSYPDFRDVRAASRTLVDLAAYTSSASVFGLDRGDGTTTTVEGSYVSENYFDLLGARPVLGRAFGVDFDTAAGEAPLVVLEHDFWRRAFGGAQDVIGRSFRLNGQPVTVVGVAPEGFRGTSVTNDVPDFWLPISMRPILSPSPGDPLVRSEHFVYVWLQVLGRRAPGATIENVQTELDRITAAMADEIPSWRDQGEGVRALAGYRFTAREAEALDHSLRLAGAVAAAVLAIAVLNVALLMVTRASARRREIAVRRALGVTRGGLSRHFLAEALVLAALGGLGGFSLAFTASGAAARWLPYEMNVPFTPDLWVFFATIGLAAATVLLFGFAPAVHLAGSRLHEALASRESERHGLQWRAAVAVAQVVLAVLLITFASTFVRSLFAASNVDLGFATERRFYASVNLAAHGYDEDAAKRFLAQAIDELSRHPGTRRVSALTMLPFRGRMEQTVTPEGGEGTFLTGQLVGPDFFATLGVPVVEGRGFLVEDDASREPVAVLSDSAARQLWPGQSALGRRLEGLGATRTVVGVVADVRFHSLSDEPPPSLYAPLAQTQQAQRFHLLIETEKSPEALFGEVERTLRNLEPALVLRPPLLLSSLVDRQIEPYRLTATLTGSFALLALVLASIGLYGVLSHAVLRERRTIGIRRALGADGRDVARSVVARALKLTALGLVLGLAAAWLGADRLEPWLFADQTPRDAVAFVVVPALLLAVAGLASWLPARRAVRVDPVEVLREE